MNYFSTSQKKRKAMEPKKTPRSTHNKNAEASTTLLLLSILGALITILFIMLYATAATTQTTAPSGGAASTTTTTTTATSNVSLVLQLTCNKTFYPLLCHSTLSAAAGTTTAPAGFTNITVAHALRSTAHALIKIQRLPPPRPAAVEDCIYMLRQTTHVLSGVLRELGRPHHRRRKSVRQLQTLISSAMTHQDSCLTGVSEGERQRSAYRGLKRRLERLLTPISQILSNSLAISKQMEKEEKEDREDERPRRSRVGLRWRSRRRSAIDVWAAKRTDAVVSGDRLYGQYRTIGDAVAAAPERSLRRFVIWIDAGVYHENVEIPVNKTNIVFVGAGMDRTVIAGNRNLLNGWTTFNSATLAVAGAGFSARDISIINTSGASDGQAVALRVSGDMAAFFRCNISGYQDTLYAHSMNQFYRECIIRGTVDFIFGNAAALFQNCEILVLTPTKGQRNMVTAQGRDDPNQPTGFSLQNCIIMAAANGGTDTTSPSVETYLGRPWRRYSRTMVMRSYLGEVVSPKGWHEWSSTLQARADLDTVELAEFENQGPGASTAGRVPWAYVNVTMEEAMQFTVGGLIGRRWLRTTAYPFHVGL